MVIVRQRAINSTSLDSASLDLPPDAFQSIVRRLREKIGLKMDAVNTLKIYQAIDQRRQDCGLPTLIAYRYYLEESRLEWQALLERVIVPETWFFRHRDSFSVLDRYIRQEWLTQPNQPNLRMLSLPCSTGEETYSLAITLLEAGLTHAKFRLDGIDLNLKSLQIAKNAIYCQNSFRESLKVTERGYFQRVGDQYQVSPRVQGSVNFKQGNLLDFSRRGGQTYHIIFCRHLLMYLESSARRRAIEGLEKLLVNSGLLFVGAPEIGLFSSPQWQLRNRDRGYVYRKHPLEKISPTIEKQANLTSEIEFREENTLEKAKKLANRGDLASAVNFCRLYLQENPTDPRAYLLLGEIERARGEIRPAQTYWQKALYLNPHCTDALMHLALLKEFKGDYQGSILIKQRLQRSKTAIS